ncbi:hypothetical protein Agub_g5378, partial [Astrephomene gubernaculifera]
LPLVPGVPPGGDVGQILLLKYWVRILKADLEVRLGAAAASGFSPDWQGQLDNSLLVRIMQTISSWSEGTHSKPALLRLMAATAVYGSMAVTRRGSGRGGGEDGNPQQQHQ